MQSLIRELRLRKHGVAVKVSGMGKHGKALASTGISDKHLSKPFILKYPLSR